MHRKVGYYAEQSSYVDVFTTAGFGSCLFSALLLNLWDLYYFNGSFPFPFWAGFSKSSMFVCNWSIFVGLDGKYIPVMKTCIVIWCRVLCIVGQLCLWSMYLTRVLNLNFCCFHEVFTAEVTVHICQYNLRNLTE